MKRVLLEKSIRKAGGRYALTVLVQKRMQELIHKKKTEGARLPEDILKHVLREVCDDLIYLEGGGSDAERRAHVYREEARKGILPDEDELPKRLKIQCPRPDDNPFLLH